MPEPLEMSIPLVGQSKEGSVSRSLGAGLNGGICLPGSRDPGQPSCPPL